MWALADDVPYSTDYHGDDDFVAGGADGPWLIKVRDACTAALAAIVDERLLPIANHWRHAEEWVVEWEPQRLADTIAELRAVAIAATGPGRHLYVWVCM